MDEQKDPIEIRVSVHYPEDGDSIKGSRLYENSHRGIFYQRCL